MSLFKANTTNNYIKPTRVKNVYAGHRKSRKQSEDKIIKITTGKIIRDNRSLYYYKPVRVGKFHKNIYIEYESKGRERIP